MTFTRVESHLDIDLLRQIILDGGNPQDAYTTTEVEITEDELRLDPNALNPTYTVTRNGTTYAVPDAHDMGRQATAHLADLATPE